MALASLSHPGLRAYLDDVRAWHGYVRFLGLPTIQDHPDTPLSDLFVLPQLATQRVTVESPPSSWPSGEDVFAALHQHRRLVVLGDPGSGKSTIVNWLAWLLAGGATGILPQWMETLLPVPLVARELKLDGVKRFDDLLDAFMARPVAAQLPRAVLIEALEKGQVLLLLDGLDEVPTSLRESLRAAVFEAWDRYPMAPFLATSRIVGYEDCALNRPRAPGAGGKTTGGAIEAAWPFASGAHSDALKALLNASHELLEKQTKPSAGRDSPTTASLSPSSTLPQAASNDTLSALMKQTHEIMATLNAGLVSDVTQASTDQPAQVCYVMPFDDGRIKAFAEQWYRLRSIKPAAQQDASAFIASLQRDAQVLQLARTPQLLTLMALVYRVRAQLPDGRAVLYDMITEAYLESIDRARQVQKNAADSYPWREKRRWLARVGFEMQLLRSAGRVSKDEGPRSKANRSGKRNQANRAAKTAPLDGDERELLVSREQVLQWLRSAMQRSSYDADASFAPDYLEWVARRSGLLLPRGEDLFAFVHLSFQEYFAALYLVEHVADSDWVIAQRDGEPYDEGDPRISATGLAAWGKDRLWQEVMVFAHECFAHQPKDARRLAGYLFGPDFADFTNSFSQPRLLKEAGNEAVRQWAAHDQRPELLARLLANPHTGLANKDREAGMQAMVAYLERVEDRIGSDSNRHPIFPDDLVLRRLLSADTTQDMLWHSIRQANPHRLNIGSKAPIDLARLQLLSALTVLYIGTVTAPDLQQIAHLSRLTQLTVQGTGDAPASLLGLERLNNLLFLSLSETGVRDLSALSKLKQLYTVTIVWSPVTDVSALAHCSQLQFLALIGTQVTSIDALDQLEKLTSLHISSTLALPPRLAEREHAGSLRVYRH